MGDQKNIPTNKTKTKARAGVTGHNVRYVLIFGLAGAIIAFLIIGLYFYGVASRLSKLTDQDPPMFLPRTPYGHHDPEKIHNELQKVGFRRVKSETIAHRSQARNSGVTECWDVRADLDNALGIASEFAGIYADRGRAYELKGQCDKAIADYRKALLLRAGTPTTTRPRPKPCRAWRNRRMARQR
jgi:hypothetical protein